MHRLMQLNWMQFLFGYSEIKINLRLVNCLIHIESCPRFSQIVARWDLKKIVVSTLWIDFSAINCIDAQKEIHKWLCASVVHIDKLMQTHQHFHSFSRGSFFMRELNSCTILFGQLHYFFLLFIEYMFQFHALILTFSFKSCALLRLHSYNNYSA